jgi:hypothetical protein
MAIDARYHRLLARRAPDDDRYLGRYAESFETAPGTTTKYLLGAMRPVASRYTERLVAQGDRVEGQLSRRLAEFYPGICFRRQGSVSNLTHIRYFSDVDVLSLIDTYVVLEAPQIPAVPYRGVPEDDLLELRRRCVGALGAAFPAVELDDTGATAIKMLKSGSLECAVDVVPANWVNTNAYARTGRERDRAVEVLDRKAWQRRMNSPFVFNDRLEVRDVETRGVLRMLIRLLKTVKADLESDDSVVVKFSSFDICSVVYRFHGDSGVSLDDPLGLIASALKWMFAVLDNPAVAADTLVVDESRRIFDEADKLDGFSRIVVELGSLWLAATKEQPSRVLLTEAHRA